MFYIKVFVLAAILFIFSSLTLMYVGVLGVMDKNFYFYLFAIFYASAMVAEYILNYIKNNKLKAEEDAQKRIADAEEEKHQIAVRRERDVLEARADVQINTIKRLHEQNVNVERQLMELRKELQSIENAENRAFMEDMIRQAENNLRR